MKKLTVFGFLFVSLLPCVLALALPGDSANHWSAVLLHCAFYFSLAFFAMATALYLVHSLSAVKSVNHQDIQSLETRHSNIAH